MRLGDSHRFLETEPDNSPAHTTLFLQRRTSQLFGYPHGLLKQTHTPNDGCARCATNFLTARSSGTKPNSDACSRNTSSTTTPNGHIEESANEHPTTPATSHRSGKATQSNDTPHATDSSTNTSQQPDPSSKATPYSNAPRKPQQRRATPQRPAEITPDEFTAPSGLHLHSYECILRYVH